MRIDIQLGILYIYWRGKGGIWDDIRVYISCILYDY